MQTINATRPADGVADDVRAAMLATIRAVAEDAAVSLADAALLAVSLGAAYADLCRLLGIAPPAPVEDALG